MESEPSRLVRFMTPRQAKLHEHLLLLFGPGPAAYYSDACRLLATTPPFDTTTHLVMHLLREIESMVRAVLYPLAVQALQAGVGTAAGSRVLQGKPLKKVLKDASDQKTSHELQIKLIAEYLGIDEDAPLIQQWLKRAGDKTPEALHRHAHREGLGAPRPVDSAFTDYLGETEQLFDGILLAFEPRYSAAIEVVNRLIAVSAPTPADAQELRQRVPNTLVLLAHFFDRIDTPLWLPHLYVEGFFRYPPKAERNLDTGEIGGYSLWPASRYVGRVAARGADHGLVVTIVRGWIETSNPWVREDIASALTALPADMIAELIPQVARWMENK